MTIPVIGEIWQGILTILNWMPSWLKFLMFLLMFGLIGNWISGIYGYFNPSVCWQSDLYELTDEWKDVLYITPIEQVLNILAPGVVGIAETSPILTFNTLRNTYDKGMYGWTSEVSSQFWSVGVCENATKHLQDWPDERCVDNWWNMFIALGPELTSQCSEYATVCNPVIAGRVGFVEINKTYLNQTDKYRVTFIAGETEEKAEARMVALRGNIDELLDTFFVTSPRIGLVGAICTADHSEPRLGVMGIDLFNFNLWLVGIFIYVMIISIKWIKGSFPIRR